MSALLFEGKGEEGVVQKKSQTGNDDFACPCAQDHSGSAHRCDVDEAPVPGRAPRIFLPAPLLHGRLELPVCACPIHNISCMRSPLAPRSSAAL
jgi:hypothetical protein